MSNQSKSKTPPQERISRLSGVSKRLFMAMSDFRGSPPQVEDALFQLASVVDATSKFHYPSERSSKRRFTNYLNSITTELFHIWSDGRFTVIDPVFAVNDGALSFGDVLYGIRCSSYHDPNEVADLIHWGNEDQVGTRDNKFVINQGLLHALFALLISDPANESIIDQDLFDDDHFMIYKGKSYPWNGFVGNRPRLMALFGNV